MTTIDRNACRALILAPLGRDAPVAAALLREAGTGTIVCADIAHFSASLSDEICCAVVTEEALRDADRIRLTPSPSAASSSSRSGVAIRTAIRSRRLWSGRSAMSFFSSARSIP